MGFGVREDDRLFGYVDFARKENDNEDESQKAGVKIYTGLQKILGVFGLLIGKTGCAKVDGKTVFYNVNSMRNFIERNGLLDKREKPFQISQPEVQKMVTAFAKHYVEKHDDIEQDANATLKAVKSDFKKIADKIVWNTHKYVGLSLQEFHVTAKEFAQIANTLSRIGFKLELKVNNNGKETFAGIPVRSERLGGENYVELSSAAITNECVRQMRDNRGGIGSLIDNYTSDKKNPAEIREFLSNIKKIADDKEQAEIQKQAEAVAKEAAKQAAKINVEDISKRIDLPTVSTNNTTNTIVIHEDASGQSVPENRIALKANNDQIATILEDDSYQLERAALVHQGGNSFNINDLVYMFDRPAFLDCLARYGVRSDIYNLFANGNGPVHISGLDLFNLRQYLFSIPDTAALAEAEQPLAIEDKGVNEQPAAQQASESGGVGAEDEQVEDSKGYKVGDYTDKLHKKAATTDHIKKIAEKEEDKLSVRDVQNIFVYMKSNCYGDKTSSGTPKKVHDYIKSLSADMRNLLKDIAWEVCGENEGCGYYKYFQEIAKGS